MKTVPPKKCKPIEKVYVLSDFDGTITVEDAAVALMNEFCHEDWYKYVKMWERHDMTLRESLKQMYEHIDATKSQVEDFVQKNIMVRKGFPEFIDWCRKNHIPFTIVSEGLDVVINATLAKYNVKTEVRTNRMLFKDNKVTIEFPETPPLCHHEDGEICGTCKATHVKNIQDDGWTVVYIGDGKTDVRPGKIADITFGRRALARTLTEQCHYFFPFENFLTIRERLSNILGL
jgi:2-hydroxy-3-keto-5-methylthiopentenyl-1-phosphate phosphatase